MSSSRPAASSERGRRIAPAGLRSAVAALCAASAFLFAGADTAGAAVYRETFDGFPAGTALGGQVPGVDFADAPSVFDPVHTTTASEPYALRSSQSCGAGCHRLRMSFGEPTNYLSVRVGVDASSAGEFPILAKLETYRAAGGLIQATPWNIVAQPFQFGPIETPFTINRGTSSDIARATVFVGTDESGIAFPGPVRASIDDLEFNSASAVGPEPPPPPPTPPPPSIEITDPSSHYVYEFPDASVSGRMAVPGGLREFCVYRGTTPPARCNQSGRAFPERDASTATTHEFAAVPLRLAPGANTISARVEDNYARSAVARVRVDVATAATGIDLAAESIDISQGIQTFGLPVPDANSRLLPSVGYSHPVAGYRGTPMVEAKRTVVRLYARAASTGSLGRPSVFGATALLHGYRRVGGRSSTELRPLPGSPLAPESDPVALYSFDDLARDRAAPGGGYTFTLPASWTDRGSIALVGEVNAPGSAPRVPECAGCAGNNAFGLRAVSFRQRRVVTVNPISMWYRARLGGSGPEVFDSPPADPADVYERFRQVSPLDLRIRPYQGYMNVSDLAGRYAPFSDRMKSALLDRLEDWEDDHEIVDPGRNLVIGIQRGLHQGVSRSDITFIFDFQEAVALVDYTRPLTSVGHETVHQLGLEHASAACGGGDDGADDWPPDQRGFLQGWGLDTTPRSGAGIQAGLAGPYWVFGARTGDLFEPRDSPSQPAEYYDLMSYCSRATGVPAPGAPADSWLSTRNWTRLVPGGRLTGSTSAAASAARRGSPGSLRVSAIVEQGGAARIERVDRGAGGLTPAAAGSRYRLLVLDRGGGVVSDTPVAPSVMHVDREGASRDLYISAEVPGRGAARVQLLRDGTPIAERLRSASPRSLRILRPRRGERIGSRGALTVRWRSSDPDSGPLQTTIEYRPNGKRRWRTLVSGAQGSVARIPADYLQRSGRSRLRLRVSDGFNERRAVTRPFRTAGRAPLVRILDVGRRTEIRGEARLVLAGEAFDDRGLMLPGRRLCWRSRGRRLGCGARIAPLGFRLGRRVTLAARDRHGRIGRASLRVRVRRAAPRFVLLRGPRRIGGRARRLRLRLKSSVAAKLSVTGRGVRSRRRRLPARRAVTVSLRVVAGRRPLRLRLRLTAGRKSSVVSRVVRRRGRRAATPGSPRGCCRPGP